MNQKQNVEKYTVQRKRHSVWRNLVTCVAAVIVFCTTYALILPAITMEKEDYTCGLVEHIHTDECYQQICGKDEVYIHYHDEDCYDELDEDKLICHLEEPDFHVHNDDCYLELICEEEEAEAHTHGDDCYTEELICENESEDHEHTAECYEEKLTCTLPEGDGHKHDDDCYRKSDDPVCGEEEPELHTHDDSCYMTICEQVEHTHDDSCLPVESDEEEAPAEDASEAEEEPEEQPTDVTDSEAQTEEVTDTEEQPEEVTDAEVEEVTETEETAESEEQTEEATESEEQTEEADNSEEQTEDASENEEQSEEATGSEEQPEDAAESEEPTEAATEVEEQPEEAIDSEEQTEEVTDTEELPEDVTESEEQPEDVTESEEQPEDVTESEEQPEDASESEQQTEDVAESEEQSEEVAEPEEQPEDATESEEQTEEEAEPEESENEQDSAIDPDEIDWSDLNAAEDAGYFWGFTCQDEEHEHTRECYLTYEEVVSLYQNVNAQNLGTAREFNGETYYYFNSSLVGDPSVSLTYKENDPTYYSASVATNYSISVDDIKAGGYHFYIDLGSDIIIPNSSSRQGTLLDPSTGERAGTFKYGTDSDGKTRIYVSFDSDYVDSKQGDISGDIEFSGQFSNSVKQENNDVIAKVFGDAAITVKAEDINYDETIEKYYDISVTKDSESITVGTDADGNKTISYTVVVSSEKGTPADTQIDFVDKLTNSPNAQLTAMTVDNSKVYTAEELSQFTNKTINLQLDPLSKNGQHTITYTYTLDFGSDMSQKTITNEAKAEVMTPYGKPINDVDTADKPVPPPDLPGISKEGNVQDGTDTTINWKISYNIGANKQDYTINGDTITDVMLSSALNGVVVKADDSALTLGTDYTFDEENGVIKLISDNVNGKEITIEFSTDHTGTDMGSWDSTTVIKNKASYHSTRYPDRETPEISVSKRGGDLSKSSGSIQESSTGLTIPWQITVIPAKGQIPTDKPLKDAIDGEAHYIDGDSVKVFYYNGDSQLGEVNTSLWEKSLAQSQYNTDTKSDTPRYMEVTFKDGIFPATGENAGADRIVVVYNSVSTNGVPTTETEFPNKASLGDRYVQPPSPKYSPASVQKTSENAEIVVDSTTNTERVKLPWTVTVYPKSGETVISSPIQDTTITSAYGYSEHEFDAAQSNFTLQYIKNDNTYEDVLDLYTIKYFGGYETQEDGTWSGTNENVPPYYFAEIIFNGDKLDLGSNYKGLKVSYNTFADVPTEIRADYYNTVQAEKTYKHATNHYTNPGADLHKEAGDVEMVNGKVRIPWTVTIDPKGFPITHLYDFLEGEQTFALGEKVTVQYWKDDAFTGESFELLPKLSGSYTESKDENDWYVYTGTGVPDPTGKYKFMDVSFNTDPMTDKEDGTYLKLIYNSYVDPVSVDTGFTNQAVIHSTKIGAAKTLKSVTVEKAVYSSKEAFLNSHINNNYGITGTVRSEDADGALNLWGIVAITPQESTGSSFIEIHDELPQWVTIENSIVLNVKNGYYNSNGTGMYSTVTIDENGAFSDTLSGIYNQNNSDSFKVSGTYKLNSNGRYELTVRFEPSTKGAVLPQQTMFGVLIEPKVDKDNIPEVYYGRDWSFSNTGSANDDMSSVGSQPSIQQWKDSRPDQMEGSLDKTSFYNNNERKLVFTVSANESGANLNPDGNSIFMVDTFEYKPFTDAYRNIGINRLEYNLDLSSVRLYYAAQKADGSIDYEEAGKDADGNVIYKMKKGDPVASSDWRWVTETETSGTGNDTVVKKIITVDAPDEKPVVLEYAYSIALDLANGKKESDLPPFGLNGKNTVELFGRETVRDEESITDYEWEQLEDSGSATASKTFKIVKIEADDYGAVIPGAVFLLERTTNGSDWEAAVIANLTDNEGKITTDAKGQINISGRQLESGYLYRLTEVAAPEGYMLPDYVPSFKFYREINDWSLKSSASNATDLSKDNKTEYVSNTNVTAKFRVEKIWYKNGLPTTSDREITLKLFQASSDKPIGTGNSSDPLNPMYNVHISAARYNGFFFSDDLVVPKGTVITIKTTKQDLSPIGVPNSTGSIAPSSKDVKKRNTEANPGWFFEYEATFVFVVNENNGTISLSPIADDQLISYTSSYHPSAPGTPENAREIGEIVLNSDNGYRWVSGPDQSPATPLVSQDGKTWYSYYVVEETKGPWTTQIVYPDGTSNSSATSGIIRVNNYLPEVEPTELSVTKQWDANVQNPDNYLVQVELHQVKDSNEVRGFEREDKIVTLSADNHWTYTWTDLPSQDGDSELTYFITESSVKTKQSDTDIKDRFTVSYGVDGVGSENNPVDVDGDVVITNVPKPETTSVTVRKTWVDFDGKTELTTNLPEKITYKLLYAIDGGTPLVYKADLEEGSDGIRELPQNGEWEVTIDNLPIDDGAGHTYTYTVEEIPVSGFETSYPESVDDDVRLIQNRKVAELTVTKQWPDGFNSSGYIVQLKLHQVSKGNEWTTFSRDDQVITLPRDDNSWTYTWTNLPAKDSYGNDFTYFVTEESVKRVVDGVEVDVSRFFTASGTGLTDAVAPNGSKEITNKYAPIPASLSLLKTWKDEKQYSGCIEFDLYKITSNVPLTQAPAYVPTGSATPAPMPDSGVTKVNESPIALYNPWQWTSKDFNLISEEIAADGRVVYYYYFIKEVQNSAYNVTYANNFTNGQTEAALSMENELVQSYELPHTGGMGTRMYTMTGLALSIGALAGLMKKRKKGES